MIRKQNLTVNSSQICQCPDSPILTLRCMIHVQETENRFKRSFFEMKIFKEKFNRLGFTALKQNFIPIINISLGIYIPAIDGGDDSV